MLFYKPETYLLPSGSQPLMSRHSQYSLGSSVRPDHDPVRGAANDPMVPPTKLRDILKQKPLDQEPPRFVRHTMQIEDIQGTKARSLYGGVAREVMQ